MTRPTDHEGAATTVPAPVARPAVTTDIALVATFAALLAVCSITAVSVGTTPVPITLQTFGVLLAGAVLGARRGALAVLLYLAVGLAGLPIFAQGVGGVGVLAKPSVGYLLAFPLAAAIVGTIVERWARRGGASRTALLLGATLLASVALYAIGVPVMAWRAGVTVPTAFVWNLIFIPLDAIKAVLAAVVASAVHRAFPDLLRNR